MLILRRPIADEKTVEYFLHNSVEDLVRAILEQLKTEEVGSIFQIGDGIVFENHPHAISDVAEVVARDTPATPPRTPNHRRDLHQLRPDQICVYRDSSVSARRTMVYVCEYKPPHKLTAPHLRVGLRAMNIYKDVTPFVGRAVLQAPRHVHNRGILGPDASVGHVDEGLEEPLNRPLLS
ncbi:uncharacterized protein PG998_014574 [Apiospora kogelbergensis]|uniref:uncharacterized protein n=1 Tax=Apiospora kogelbergensis TaxID=1337665 RepID=UPI00312D91EC